MAKKPSNVLWLRNSLVWYLEIAVKLLTCINKQRTTADNPELFHYCFAKLFNNNIKNHIKLVNMYNINKKDFLIVHIKHGHIVVHMGHKNLWLIE